MTLVSIAEPDYFNNQTAVPDTQRTKDVKFPDALNEIGEIIDKHIAHFYEAIKSSIAISKIKRGINQPHDTLVLEMDYRFVDIKY